MKRILSVILSISLLAGMMVPGRIVSNAAEIPTDIIIDNKDIPDSDKKGTWTAGSSRTGKYGADYLTSMGAAGKETSVIWRPDIKEKGMYSVYFQIPNSTSNASDIANQAEYEVVYSDKSDRHEIDQRGKGGEWNLLGQYLFEEGTAGYVKLNAKKYSGRNVHTFADAIKFQPISSGADKTYDDLQRLISCMPETQNAYTDDSWNKLQSELEKAEKIKENMDAGVIRQSWADLLAAWKELVKEGWLPEDIIVDNPDIAEEDKIGTWTRGTSRTGKYGADYVSSRTEGSSITWRPEIRQAGAYNVYFQIPDSSASATDIASDAVYEVISEKGTEMQTIDQRGIGGKWNLLGQYKMTEGTNGAVRMSVKETSNRNAMADAVRFQLVDILLDDRQFTMTNGWERISDEQASGAGAAKTQTDGAGAESRFIATGTGYYAVKYLTTPGMDGFSMNCSLKIGDTSFDINPEELQKNSDIGSIYLEEGKEYPVKIQMTGSGTGYLDAVKLEHTLFDKYYEGFYRPESIDGWTISGTASVADGCLTVSNGEAHTERNSWDNIKVEAELTAEETGADSTFGMILSGTNNSYLRLIFDTQSGKVILKEDYGETEEPIAVSEGTLDMAAGKRFLVKAEFAYPNVIISIDGKEMLRSTYARSGNMGFYAENSRISVNYMGVQESDGKGRKEGSFKINIGEPRQTIWGLGIEIQSDSIGSGNNGLPDSQVRSIPYGINESERDRLYEDMLKGFRYLRLAGGLYYRGTDENGKHLQERWDTQDEELAELIDKSGIEGIDFEFWSPTPYFKASGSYMEPKNNSGLKCFSEDFTGDKQEFLEDFADTVAEDLRAMADKGIPVIQFGLQNEAPHNVSTYSHCHYEPQEYYETMKVMVPRLREEFPDIHIHADSWKGQYSAGSKLIIEDEELLKDIDGWTFHRIGYSSNDQINNKEYFTSKKGRDDIVVYNNEFEYFTGASDWNCINTAQSLMNWMVFEESPTWHWLHALKPFGNSEAGGFALGFFHPYDYGEDEMIPKGYEHIEKGEWEYNYRNWNSVRGFLKYMPWNSIRYTVEEDEVRMDQRIMSWQTPEGNQVIALTNRSVDDYFTFNIDTGLEEDQWKGYRYTPGEKDEIQLEAQSGTSINPMLPPLSIEFWVQEGVHEVPERGVRMEKENEEIAVGESVQLKAEVVPSDAPIKGVTWSSSDKDIVTVDRNGKITGISKGTAVIKATRKDGGYYASCSVTVTDPAEITYAIVTDQKGGAVIKASPSDSARAGETVSVEVTDIDAGMEVSELSVTTSAGNKISVTDVADDASEGIWRFEFIMPAEDVFVAAEIEMKEETRLRRYLEDLLKIVASYIDGREAEFTEETMADLKEAMEHAEDILGDEGSDKKVLKKAYDILAEAQKNLKKAEKEQDEEYLIFIIGSEAAVTASPSDAVKAGTGVNVDISDIPEGKELDQVIVATSSDAARKIPVKEVTEGVPEDIEARYSFKMPASDVFVFITLKDIDNKVLAELRRMIQIAGFYLESADKYTMETLAVLEAELWEAIAAADNPDYEEAEWREACELLKKAIESLERVIPEDDFYLIELKELADEIQKLDRKLYTDESWNALEEVLKAAEDILGKEGCSYREVRQAYEALKKAADKLERKKADSSSGSDSGSSSVSSSSPTANSRSSGTWIQDAAGWRYLLPGGGYTADRWQQINGVWYRFGTDAYMMTGWVNDSVYNGWFYLDNTGAMVTGWQLIDGKWYYFHTVSDGNKGKMLSDTVTPDGFKVGIDGNWIQ